MTSSPDGKRLPLPDLSGLPLHPDTAARAACEAIDGHRYERIMLVDGMGLLVRCAKAAARAPALSHGEHITGPLTFFAGALSARLGQHQPSHVVVCWEGAPQENWRSRLYPEYKSNRRRTITPPSLAETVPDPGRVSADEKLARRFCAAAGVRQDQSARFEGDDMIAAWWRFARQAAPSAHVMIVSDDKDLHQLCDDATAVYNLTPAGLRALDGPAMNAQEAELYWRCPPERLPLLRALAGDPSDGIPGVPGIGLVKAAAIVAGMKGDPEQHLRKLAEAWRQRESVPEMSWTPWGLANMYRVLMELRSPFARPYQEDTDAVRMLAEAEWRPDRHSRTLLAFLEEFGMKRMKTRLLSGKFPWPAPD